MRLLLLPMCLKRVANVPTDLEMRGEEHLWRRRSMLLAEHINVYFYPLFLHSVCICM